MGHQFLAHNYGQGVVALNGIFAAFGIIIWSGYDQSAYGAHARAEGNRNYFLLHAHVTAQIQICQVSSWGVGTCYGGIDWTVAVSVFKLGSDTTIARVLQVWLPYMGVKHIFI